MTHKLFSKSLLLSIVLGSSMQGTSPSNLKAHLAIDGSIAWTMYKIGKWVKAHAGSNPTMQALAEDFADATRNTGLCSFIHGALTMNNIVHGKNEPAFGCDISGADAEVNWHTGFTLSNTTLRFGWRHLKQVLEMSDMGKGIMQTLRDVLPESVRPLAKDLVFSFIAMKIYKDYTKGMVQKLWKLVPPFS